MRYLALLIPLAAAAAGCSDDGDTPTGPSGPPVSFFVTSQTSVTGNLGGLAGADATCQRLATAAGPRREPHLARLPERRARSANGTADPRPRSHRRRALVQRAAAAAVANNLAELHARTGDAALFLDERGQRINGQWTGSPAPVEHDILTGSNADGTLAAGSPAPTGPRTPPRPSARSATPTASGRARAGRHRWPRGTPRTRTRTARTRRRAAAPAASTASRSRRPQRARPAGQRTGPRGESETSVPERRTEDLGERRRCPSSAGVASGSKGSALASSAAPLGLGPLVDPGPGVGGRRATISSVPPSADRGVEGTRSHRRRRLRPARWRRSEAWTMTARPGRHAQPRRGRR